MYYSLTAVQEQWREDTHVVQWLCVQVHRSIKVTTFGTFLLKLHPSICVILWRTTRAVYFLVVFIPSGHSGPVIEWHRTENRLFMMAAEKKNWHASDACYNLERKQNATEKLTVSGRCIRHLLSVYPYHYNATHASNSYDNFHISSSPVWPNISHACYYSFLYSLLFFTLCHRAIKSGSRHSVQFSSALEIWSKQRRP